MLASNSVEIAPKMVDSGGRGPAPVWVGPISGEERDRARVLNRSKNVAFAIERSYVPYKAPARSRPLSELTP